MKYIDFVVRNKHIESRQNAIIADNTDYMMRFAFDEGWEGYPDKTVLVLDNEGKIWELHLTGGATEVKLPKFIGRKLLAVGVTATAGDGEISTDAVSLRVDPSIRTGASEAIGSPESGAMDMLEEYREKCETLIAELQAAIDSTYLGVTDAKIGQTVRITAVDEGGNPTEWEAVEFPEQVQSDYEQNDNSAKDYIKNRPFYDSTETTDISGTSVRITASDSVTHDFIPLQVGQEWRVTAVGKVEYEETFIVAENEQGEPYLGTTNAQPVYIRQTATTINSGFISSMGLTALILTCLSGTYTQQGAIKKIDPKFLPDVSSLLVVNLTMNGGDNITADKTFAEIKAAHDDGKVVDAKFADAIVPLCSISDSEAFFAVTQADSGGVFTASFTCTSDNVWSMSQDVFDADGHSLGISGATVGQIVKIKAVDESGAPTEWESVSGGDEWTQLCEVELTEATNAISQTWVDTPMRKIKVSLTTLAASANTSYMPTRVFTEPGTTATRYATFYPTALPIKSDKSVEYIAEAYNVSGNVHVRFTEHYGGIYGNKSGSTGGVVRIENVKSAESTGNDPYGNGLYEQIIGFSVQTYGTFEVGTKLKIWGVAL